MSGLDIPALVDTAEVTEWSDDVDVVVIGLGSAAAARLSRPRPPGPAFWFWNAPPWPAVRPRWPGGHFYLGGGTAVQQATGHADSADEMYKYLVAVSREPETTRSGPIATTASNTSTGSNNLASTSNAATTPQSGDSAQHRRAHVHGQ